VKAISLEHHSEHDADILLIIDEQDPWLHITHTISAGLRGYDAVLRPEGDLNARISKLKQWATVQALNQAQGTLIP
jgi:hypothetical protein